MDRLEYKSQQTIQITHSQQTLHNWSSSLGGKNKRFTRFQENFPTTLLLNLKVHYRVQTSQQMKPILSQVTVFHALTGYLFKIILNTVPIYA
jgi:hypothetical protein